MLKNIDVFPEVFLSGRDISSAISRASQAGTIRKIGPKLYTRNTQDAEEAVVLRNLWQIVGLLAPGTIVSYRTAFENRPAPDGSIFLSGRYQRNLTLPGITIRQLAGAGPLLGDTPYMGSLYLASRARSFLENLSPSRARDKVSKTVGREDIERRLAELLRVRGESALNQIRDEARAIAPAVGLEPQAAALDQLVAALLRSRSVPLSAPTALAYAAGEPYDPHRATLFNALFRALRSNVWPDRPDRALRPPASFNAAFFDAYFSNYIEGTTFPVAEAIGIVFHGHIPANRPADAHDVLGTYRLVASSDEMRHRPADFAEFLDLLRRRHATVMVGRPAQLPGQFKTRPNQAGATLFVAPELVVGTLHQGYNLYQSLDDPFARGLFMMFLIAEVHPFMDGNGRMARVMMNADLIEGSQTRIMIPSVYRNEYINSLKRLTNYADPDAFLRVMSYAQLFVSRIDFTDLESARQMLASCRAFDDPADDIKLKMPIQ